jgi:hypothetical protein
MPLLAAIAASACSHNPIRRGAASGDVSSSAMSSSDVLSVLQVDPSGASSQAGAASPTCYDYRTTYGRVERSIGGTMHDKSSFYVDVAGTGARRPSDISVFRAWPDSRRVRVSSSDHGSKPDRVKVVTWRGTKDRHPSTVYFPKDGPVGARLHELGTRALTVSCARTTAPRRAPRTRT